MKKVTFYPGIYISNTQKEEHNASLQYLDTAGPMSISVGCKSVIKYLLKQEDIWKIETEVSMYDEDKRLKTDIIFYFTNGNKGSIEFNGTQHFTWSSWYPYKSDFTKQNKSLLNKEISCLQKGFHCLNINDLTYIDTPLMDEDEDPYADLRKQVKSNYVTFFEAVKNGYCPQLRLILDEMKKEKAKMYSYNIKLSSRNWEYGFRNSSDEDLDKIMYNMCNDDTYVTYL